MTFPAGGYADLAAAIADGLMSYVPFDETQGYVVTDLVSGHNLSVGRGPAEDSITVGAYGNARSLYNLYGYDPIPSHTLISRGNQGTSTRTWTAAFRFKAQDPPGPATNGAHTVLSYHTSTSNRAIHVFYGAFNLHSTVQFSVSGAISPTFVLTGVDMPAAGVWHSIVVVSDEALLETRLYIDGVLRATQTQFLSQMKYAGPESTIWAGSATAAARAEVDDFCAWNRVFSDQEAADFHNSPVMPNQGVVGTPLVNEFQYLRTYSTRSFTSECIGYGDGRWIISGYDSGGVGLYVWTSDDNGATWVERLVTALTFDRFTALAYGGAGLWVASMNSGDMAVSTDNGVTWTIRAQGVTGWGATSQINGVAYGNGVWVFTGYGGRVAWMTDPVAGIMTMLDRAFFGLTTYCMRATYHDGVWLVGGRGPLWKSTDNAQSFVAITDDLPMAPATNRQAWFTAYSGAEFIAAGSRYESATWTGTVWRSQDAVTWVMDTDFDGQSMSFQDLIKPASGGNNQFLVSSNSSQFIGGFGDWLRYQFATTDTFYDSAFANGRFMVLAGVRQVYSAEVDLLELVQEATINVEVDFERPVITAATMPEAAISVAINVIAGTLRDADIAVEVGLYVSAYARNGYMNLLDGLVGYWPLDAYNIYNRNAVVENDLADKWQDIHRNTFETRAFAWKLDLFYEVNDQFLQRHSRGSARFETLEYSVDYPLDPDNGDPRTLSLPYTPITDQAFTATFWAYIQDKPATGEAITGLFVSSNGYLEDESIELCYKRIMPPGGVLDADRENLLWIRLDGNLFYDGAYPPYRGDVWYEWLTDGEWFPKYVLPTNEWLFFVVKRRGRSLQVLVNNEVVFDFVPPAGNLGTGEITLGNLQFFSLESGSSIFGFIDEAGFWSRELQPDELERLYAEGNSIPYPFISEAIVFLDVGVNPGARLVVDYRKFLEDRQAHHFVGVITGAEDELDDLVVPILYWQATRQVPEQSSYLQMVVPVTTEAMAGLAERPNGRMIIRSRYRTGDYTWEEDFVWAPVQEVGFTRSLSGQTLQIQGRQLVPAPAFPITWLVADEEVMRFDVQSEKRRVRLNLNLWMRPGESVTVFGETFVIGWINLYANNSGAFMDVGEVGG